nr:MAG TPA: hypothetical protein [Caudoviricetes sp.]
MHFVNIRISSYCCFISVYKKHTIIYCKLSLRKCNLLIDK